MSLKLKVLGMGLLAVMATSAFAVMNAGATEPGHFTSDVDHTTIVGTETLGTEHVLHLTGDTEGEIGCTTAEYHGTATGTTVESLTITPTYHECYTTPTHTSGNTIGVTMNGCTYTFTVTKGATHHPVHLECPEGKAIEIHHPNCTITIGKQTVEEAVDYTTVIENGKHAITMDVTADFASQYHGGICIFLGTNHKGSLDGSVTVQGFDTENNQVNITAT